MQKIKNVANWMAENTEMIQSLVIIGYAVLIAFKFSASLA